MSGTSVSFLFYDYSSNIKNSLVISNINTVTAIALTSQNFSPPVDFIRMNFLPLNNFYANSDLDVYKLLLIFKNSFILS